MSIRNDGGPLRLKISTIWFMFICCWKQYWIEYSVYLQCVNLSGTYCHKTGTRTPSFNTPWEPTIYLLYILSCLKPCKLLPQPCNPLNISFSTLWFCFMAKNILHSGFFIRPSSFGDPTLPRFIELLHFNFW